MTIGVTQTPGPMDIPRELAAFSRRYPGVELIVREGLSVSLAAELREDRIDLAVVSGIDSRERHQLEFEAAAVSSVWSRSCPPSTVLRAAGDSASPTCGRAVRQLPSRSDHPASRRARCSQAPAFVPRASIETNDVGPRDVARSRRTWSRRATRHRRTTRRHAHCGRPVAGAYPALRDLRRLAGATQPRAGRPGTQVGAVKYRRRRQAGRLASASAVSLPPTALL